MDSGTTTPEVALNTVREQIDRVVEVVRSLRLTKEDGQPVGGRELALVVTNLQQARMWAGEAMREAGLVQPYSNSETQETPVA